MATRRRDSRLASGRLLLKISLYQFFDVITKQKAFIEHVMGKNTPPTIASEQQREFRIRLETHTWKIWEYVRANQNSLDSERCIGMIRAGFEAATDDEHTRLVESLEANTELRKKHRSLRAERDGAKEELSEVSVSLEKEIRLVVELEDLLSDAVAQVQRLQNENTLLNEQLREHAQAS